MRKDNPACYGCSKGKNNIHYWQIHKTSDGTVLGANCIKCELFLNKEDTDDMRSE